MSENGGQVKSLVEALGLTSSFGFEIKDKTKKKKLQSIAPPTEFDGATFTSYNSFYNQTINFNEGYSLKNEVNLIERYREMEKTPEIDMAVDEIVNEIVVIDEELPPVQLNLDNVELSDKTKSKILDEWQTILKLFNFRKTSYEIVRRWYVDSRIFYNLVIDKDNGKKGIQEVRYVDPRKIKKVKEPVGDGTNRIAAANPYIHPEYEEYYIFSPTGIDNAVKNGIRIPSDSIAYAHSGLEDPKTGIVLSQLHKAIKPLNILRMLEDAFIIYKLARAPERRIFYIDVGGVPPTVADRYLTQVAQKYKQKVSYDASSGEISNERLHMTMLQDFFLPQRDGKGTQVDTLSGGDSSFTDMNQVDYHRKKLYQSLNIPISRIDEGGPFNLGRPSEITRDEVKFSKFIKRLRMKFIVVLEQALKIQLALKNVMTKEEFDDAKTLFRYDFLKDNLYSELKEQDIWTNRLDLLDKFDRFAGIYFSRQWIKKRLLHFTEEEITEMDTQINTEESQGEYEKSADVADIAGIGVQIKQKADAEVAATKAIIKAQPPMPSPKSEELSTDSFFELNEEDN